MTHLYNNIINISLESNDIDFKNKTIIVVDDGAALQGPQLSLPPGV